jgi:Na+/H+ antiporter NhaD/arsenite permease-like protein
MQTYLKNLGLWLMITAAILLGTGLFFEETQMALALTALLAAITGTVIFGEERLPLVTLGLVMILAGGLIDFEHLVEGMEWVLFIKLVALLSWVDFLNHTKYFDYLIESYLPRNFRGFRLMALLFFLAAVSAALIDEVNSIVLWYFVTRSLIGFTKDDKLKLRESSWVALVILLVSATNIGSQFLPLGNPVGIAVSVLSGLTAVDFIRYTWVPGLATLAYFIFRVWLTKRFLIANFKATMQLNAEDYGVEKRQTKEVKAYVADEDDDQMHPVQEEQVPIPLLHALFGAGVIGLVASSPLSEALGFDGPTGLGLFVLSLFAVTLFIASAYKRHTEQVLSELPWSTLFFIMFLFAIAHGLEVSGLTEEIADTIFAEFGDNELAVRLMIIGVAALVTAFMDNVIAIAIIAPIIIALGDRGYETVGLWFSLLVSAVVAGNLTPIGSTANIIANARIRASWGEWWRVGGLLALECLVINQVVLYFWERVV